jgi:hypothetical protein
MQTQAEAPAATMGARGTSRRRRPAAAAGSRDQAGGAPHPAGHRLELRERRVTGVEVEEVSGVEDLMTPAELTTPFAPPRLTGVGVPELRRRFGCEVPG